MTDMGEDFDWERRFGGMARLYGVAAAERIRRAHVGVVGIGGVGSWVAEALARSGVGRLTLIDLDHVAESNINRQVHATTASLGQAKVQAMRERIALINPACDVRCVDEFVERETWPALVPMLDELDELGDYCSRRSAGNRMMSRMLAESVSNIIKRSIPIPQPPVGGMPYSRARTKSWSKYMASSSPPSLAATWALKRAAWSSASFSSEKPLPNSRPVM